LNHEELVTQLSKALAQIAVVLPTANAKILLYPTEQIKRAISLLYAQIIKFIVRAMNWYHEGRMRHLISSVFRPATLRFQDLLEEIRSCSQNIDQLSMNASQAELRDMHFLFIEMKRMMAGDVSQTLPIFSTTY